MTAEKSIQHSEMFTMLNSEIEKPLEIFQIWLNLPKASKMVDPHFKMLWREEIPIVIHEDVSKRKTSINIIAGRIYDAKAPKPTPDSWAATAEMQ